MEAAGFSSSEIAEILGMTAARVSVILNDPRADMDRKEFASGVIERMQDVQLKIALHADEALDEILDEMRNVEDPRVRQKAAFGILDRAGYTPVQKSIQAKAELPTEMLHRMSGVLSEMQAIDAEYQIVEAEEIEEEEEDDTS